MSIIEDKQTSYSFAACRALGHAWDQIPAKRRPSWGTLLVFRCMRCGTERDDTLDAFYRLSTRTYHHPDGYKTDQRDRREWRELWVTTEAKPPRKDAKLVERPPDPLAEIPPDE